MIPAHFERVFDRMLTAPPLASRHSRPEAEGAIVLGRVLRRDTGGSVTTGGRVRRMEPWEAGYAVRRDWPDGSHDLVGFRSVSAKLGGFIRRDRAYWRRGPLRPDRWTVVVVSRRDFDLHAARPGCRSPDCPPTW